MTNLCSADRRRERRYIVCGIDSWIDGHPCQIVDISSSAVKLLPPAGFEVEDRAYTVVFDVPQEAAVQSYCVTGRLVRYTEIYVVLSYQPPCEDWDALLLSLDTFEMTRLTAL